MTPDEAEEKLQADAKLYMQGYEKGKEMERERLAAWALEKVRGHRKIAIEKQDAGDSEMASTHLAIETAYFGIIKELEEYQEGTTA